MPTDRSTESPILGNQARIIRLPEVKWLSGLCRSAIYQRSKDGLFPSPISLGGRAVGWVEAEVLAWVEERIRESRAISGEQR
jgi:prophage regulatory protein